MAAFRCSHPDLDAVDVLLLTFLIENGDYGTGKNCRPGNYELAHVARISLATVKRRLAALIERGLIERTERGDGRSTASIYRICWESTFYPDFESENKPAHPGEPDSRSKLAHPGEPVILQTGSSDALNRLTEVAKPAHLAPKLAHLGEPTPEPTRSTHTHSPASESEHLESNTFAHVAKYLELDMLTSQWKRGEMDKAEALIREHGWKKFYAVQRLYWQEQDPEQFSKTLFRWTGLLNSFSGLLGKVTAEMLQEQDTDRFRKEHPEEWQRIQDESMERQARELVRIRFTNNTPKEPIAECTTPLEDFLNKD